MLLIDILELSIFELDPRLLGRSLDTPRGGQTHSDSLLMIEGWVVGRDSRAVAVELVGEDGTFRRFIVDRKRPDVEIYLQGAQGSEHSGFGGALRLTGSFETGFVFRAVLADHQRVPLATMRLSRRWETSGDPGERQLVSIVIPCYGQANLLGEAIESAASQSHPDVEVIVVDDGSPDGTEIVARKFPGVRYEHQQNQGLAAARNRGLQLSRGEFIIFLDADDRLTPHAAACHLRALRERPDAAFSFGGHRIISAGGQTLKENRGSGGGETFTDFLAGNHVGCPAAAMYRRALFNQVRPFDVAFHPAEDYELYLRVTGAYAVVSFQEIVAEYRMHGPTLSSDHVRMLTAVLKGIEANTRGLKGADLKRAVRNARHSWGEYFGQLITQQLVDGSRSLRGRKRAEAILALLIHHRRGLLSLAHLKAAAKQDVTFRDGTLPSRSALSTDDENVVPRSTGAVAPAVDSPVTQRETERQLRPGATKLPPGSRSMRGTDDFVPTTSESKRAAVSIIVPSFDHGRFLGDTLDSVAGQTFTDWECIIVNDGSRDDTEEIAKRAVRRDFRFRYLFQTNRGLSAARNRGVGASTGKYLQFLDADDLIDPQKLQTQIELMESDPAIGVTYSNYRPFASESGDLLDRFWPEMLTDDPLEDFLFRWERGLCIPIHCAIFRRDLWEADKPVFDERLPAREDWKMWISLALRQVRFQFVDRELAFYRMHAKNMFLDRERMNYWFMEAAQSVAEDLSPPLAERFLQASVAHCGVNASESVREVRSSANAISDGAKYSAGAFNQRFRAPGRPFIGCTIAARNYLAQALVLARSFLRFERASRFYVLLVDGDLSPSADDDRLIFVHPSVFRLDDWIHRTFQYDAISLCTALKPALLKWLLDSHPQEMVLFLDPDVMVFQPLDALAGFDHHGITLTPQITKAIPPDGKYPTELNVMSAGTFNLGFIAVTNGPDTGDFLAWWDDRLRRSCIHDQSRGYFFDQKWVDLAPSMYESVRILRDETYNVAYWNLPSRTLSGSDEHFRVNGKPLTFFHFSGLDLETSQFKTTHTNRIAVTSGSCLGEIITSYRRALDAAGYEQFRREDYGYGQWDDGTKIHWLFRELFRTMADDQRARFPNPFRTGSGSFNRWARTRQESKGDLSPIEELIYRLRPDVAAAYPDVPGADRERFLSWTRTSGVREFGYDAEVLHH